MGNGPVQVIFAFWLDGGSKPASGPIYSGQLRYLTQIFGLIPFYLLFFIVQFVYFFVGLYFSEVFKAMFGCRNWKIGPKTGIGQPNSKAVCLALRNRNGNPPPILCGNGMLELGSLNSDPRTPGIQNSSSEMERRPRYARVPHRRNMKAVYRALMKGSLVRTFAGVTGFLGIPREQRGVEILHSLFIVFSNLLIFSGKHSFF